MAAVVAEPIPRSVQRQGYPTDIHLQAIDNDIDLMVGSLQRIDARITRGLVVASGALVTFSTSMVLLALNLLGGH